MRRGLSLGVLLAALLGAGCDQVSGLLFRSEGLRRPGHSSATSSGLPRREPPPSPGPPSGASDSQSAPPREPAHVELAPSVRRKMKLSPRRAPVSDLAFGKGRLGVLTDDALTVLAVRDLTPLSRTLRIPLEGPRAIIALADGSLLASGASRSLRLLPHDVQALPVQKLTLLPDSSLLGDRQNPDRVWVLPASGKTLFGYDVARGTGGVLVPAEWLELEGYDQRSLASVRDGSFLYTTPSDLRQFYGSGKKEPVSARLDPELRLLPASRPDTVWSVARRSARLHRILAGKLVPLRSVELSAPVYDAAADGELLAVLELVQPDDAPWRFVLEVFDVRGARHCRVPLPANETLGEDWVARLIGDRGLALSADPPLVAVGGRTHVEVRSARDGTVVFSGP